MNFVYGCIASCHWLSGKYWWHVTNFSQHVCPVGKLSKNMSESDTWHVFLSDICQNCVIGWSQVTIIHPAPPALCAPALVLSYNISTSTIQYYHQYKHDTHILLQKTQSRNCHTSPISTNISTHNPKNILFIKKSVHPTGVALCWKLGQASLPPPSTLPLPPSMPPLWQTTSHQWKLEISLLVNSARDAAFVGGGVGNFLVLGGADIAVVIGNGTRDSTRIGGGASRPLEVGGTKIATVGRGRSQCCYHCQW